MQTLYENQKIAKYGVPEAKYLLAIAGASFYIIMTLFLAIAILSTYSKPFKNWFLLYNTKFTTVLAYAMIMLLLRAVYQEDKLHDKSLTEEIIMKRINYYLVYLFGVGLAFGFVLLKFRNN